MCQEQQHKLSGLDAYDGTPVLDLKPYTPGRVVKEFRLPPWYEQILRKAGIRDF